MDVLEALLNRVSVARLNEPAPNAAQREQLFAAALRAPDHGQLRPWRFLTIEAEARLALGELFAKALRARPEVNSEAVERALKAPLRAPLVVVVVASMQAHPKVPEQEQLLSAACAAHGLLLAADALGFGAMWRTGDLSYDPIVAAGLGLASHEQIIGFVYLGSVEGARRTPAPLAVADFVQSWPA